MSLTPLLQQADTTELPTFLLIVIAIAVLLDLLFFFTAVRIVPEHQRLVVFRLGRFVRVAGPGLAILLLFIDAATRVDLREQTVQHEESVTTQDERRVVVDWLWNYQVVDAAKAVLNVEHLDATAQERASSILRSIIGAMTLNEVMFAREDIRAELQTRLCEIVEAWGVQVRQVGIREVKRN